MATKLVPRRHCGGRKLARPGTDRPAPGLADAVVPVDRPRPHPATMPLPVSAASLPEILFRETAAVTESAPDRHEKSQHGFFESSPQTVRAAGGLEPASFALVHQNEIAARQLVLCEDLPRLPHTD